MEQSVAEEETSRAHFERLRGQLRVPFDAGEFVPPPRFATATFASYQIDGAVAGQAAAVDGIQAFVVAGSPRWWQWRRRGERRGLYLDGDFGVGKTHLLAAAFHAATGRRRYLSFSEAISLLIAHGLSATVDLLQGDLLCLDEFELDDPSNTRHADQLIDRLVSAGTRLIVTSNTVPGELGVGRMFVDQFRNQLARVAATFADIHVPGEDYRRRHGRAGASGQGWGPTVTPLPSGPVIDADELDRLLRDIPVVSLRRLAAGLPALSITGMTPRPDQLCALRLVHLVDRLYDWRVPLRVQADCAIDELFLPGYRELGFAKKYRRCQSRLIELCAEATA